MESEPTSGTSFTTIRIQLFSVQVPPRSVREQCFVIGASLSTGGRRPTARYRLNINAGARLSQGNGCECSSREDQAFVFAGRRLSPRCVVAFEDAGFTFKDSLAWLRESAPHRAQRVSVVFQRRGDDKSANKWEGWRVGNLRPTFEPILWFVKPYPTGTTIADNVLAHEVGAFNEQAFTRYEQVPDNVLRSGFAKGERGLHLAQKPVKLLRALIELATVPGQIVLDPFCGSGLTLVAAKSIGRECLGFENDIDMAARAQKRLMETPKWASTG